MVDIDVEPIKAQVYVSIGVRVRDCVQINGGLAHPSPYYSLLLSVRSTCTKYSYEYGFCSVDALDNAQFMSLQLVNFITS